jgi:phospholipase C
MDNLRQIWPGRASLPDIAIRRRRGGGRSTAPAPKRVEHIVVLMVENRSFDNMLAHLTTLEVGARPANKA